MPTWTFAIAAECCQCGGPHVALGGVGNAPAIAHRRSPMRSGHRGDDRASWIELAGSVDGARNEKGARHMGALHSNQRQIVKERFDYSTTSTSGGYGQHEDEGDHDEHSQDQW